MTGQPQAVVGEGTAALKGVRLAIEFVPRTGNLLAHALAHLPLYSLDVMETLDLPAVLATII